MSFTRRNRSLAWRRLDALEYQLIPLKIQYKASAEEFEKVAVEITAILFEIWRAARHPEVSADFYIEIAKMPGNTLFAKLCTYYLNYTKVEFQSNGSLQRKHTEMTGVLDLLDKTWPKDKDAAQKDIIEFINDRGGITRVYMAYLGRKAKEKRDAEDALLQAEQDRKELEAQAVKDRIELEALRNGMTVDQYLADQTIKSEQEKENEFLATIQIVIDAIAANGAIIATPKGDSTFYVMRKRKLVKISQTDVYDLLACKAKLARPRGL